MEKTTILDAVQRCIGVGEKFTSRMLLKRDPTLGEGLDKRSVRNLLRARLFALARDGSLEIVGKSSWGALIYQRVG